jgi:hypothetical protein
MRRIKVLVILAAIALTVSVNVRSSLSYAPAEAAQGATKPADEMTLSKEAKLGTVAFSHVNHSTKNYNVAGTGTIACVECHHTAQPAAEAAKHPPLKTAQPADRTTTLTQELLDKDPAAVGTVACTSCHARAGATPTALPAIPQIQPEGGAAVTLTNQQAFHKNCAGCHDQVLKARPDAKAPAGNKCMACHKK